MEGLFVVLVYGFIITLVIMAALFVQSSTYKAHTNNLRRFAQRLEGSELRLDTGTFKSLANTSLEGTLDGRDVGIGFRIVGSGKHKHVYVCFTVDVANPAADFKVTPAGFLDRLGRAFGVVSDVKVGDAEFDSDYLVSGAARQVRSLFQSRHLGRLFDRLTQRYGLRSIELEDGKLRFERGLNPGLDPGLLERTFASMFELGELCERRQVQVKVLGEKPRFAWTGGSKQALCPYCRDSVDLDGEDVSACSDCDTVHHKECLQEAGGCTIFGCTARRDRTRA